MKNTKIAFLVTVVLSANPFITTSNVNATLLDRGATVYDNDLGISWLKNANLAASNTFGVVNSIDPSGLMNWSTALQWIGAMNTANYLGYSDWRLPTTLQPDTSCQYTNGSSYGYNCTGSEMGHLYYTELGGHADSGVFLPGNANFSNLQPNGYWTDTSFRFDSQAWYFEFGAGNQRTYTKSQNLYAWAVRDGDVPTVSVSAVPEPETYTILLAGLVLLGFINHRAARASNPEI